MGINKIKLKKVMIVAVFGIVYYFWVTLTGLALKCPVYTVTRHHIKCPGCGVSRACISLAHLDISGAFYSHPVAVALGPLWAVCIVLWLFDRGVKFNRVVSIISLAALLVYFVVRNLPGFPLN